MELEEMGVKINITIVHIREHYLSTDFSKK